MGLEPATSLVPQSADPCFRMLPDVVKIAYPSGFLCWALSIVSGCWALSGVRMVSRTPIQRQDLSLFRRSYRCVKEWQDLDSNRGHHDFQLCGRRLRSLLTVPQPA